MDQHDPRVRWSSLTRLRAGQAVARALAAEHGITCVAHDRGDAIGIDDARGGHTDVVVVELDDAALRAVYAAGRYDKPETIAHVRDLVRDALADASPPGLRAPILAMSIRFVVGTLFIRLVRVASAPAAAAYREVWLVAADRALRLHEADAR